jgi:cell division septum initiation protein DivIVA
MAKDPTDGGQTPPSLPRSFRGYNRRATEELVRRLNWEYGVLAGEHRKLKQSVEERSAPRTRVDYDEEAHALLAAAQKAARELRESVRIEGEQALMKARRRAAEIEAEASRAAGASTQIMKRAAALRATLSDALQRVEQGELPQAPRGSDGATNGETFQRPADGNVTPPTDTSPPGL